MNKKKTIIKCPHCEKDITSQVMAKLGAEGGAKSKRKLSSKDAAAMAKKRWEKDPEE